MSSRKCRTSTSRCRTSSVASARCRAAASSASNRGSSSAGATVFRDAIPVGEDGTFRIEGLVPESYQIFVNDGGKPLRGGTGVTVEPEARDPDVGLQDLVEIRVTRAPR